MTNALLAALDLNTRQVLDALAPLDTDAINRKPNSGVWSLAQVVDHLTRAEWGWFTIIHTERHLVQFTRIQTMLKDS